jgi:hypothetical protein
LDNDQSPSAAESGESQLTEGQDSSTVEGRAAAGNGGISRTDSSVPIRRGNGRDGSAMGEERAVTNGEDQGYDQGSVAGRKGGGHAGGASVPDAEDRRDQSDGAASPDDEADGELILIDNGDAFRSQWESVQIGFVDDPRQAVQDAQDLLSSVVDELIDGFRRTLDESLSGDDDRSTDQLRHTFRRYRVLFERLLST